MHKDIGVNHNVMKLHLTIRLAKKKSYKIYFPCLLFVQNPEPKAPRLLVKSPAQYRG